MMARCQGFNGSSEDRVYVGRKRKREEEGRGRGRSDVTGGGGL